MTTELNNLANREAEPYAQLQAMQHDQSVDDADGMIILGRPCCGGHREDLKPNPPPGNRRRGFHSVDSREVTPEIEKKSLSTEKIRCSAGRVSLTPASTVLHLFLLVSVKSLTGV